MPKTVEIMTPEAVSLQLELAGIGSRFVAVFADFIILSLVTFAFVLLIILLSGTVAALNNITATMTLWIMAFSVVALFLLWQGYYIFFETVTNGQTPGKRSVGIRVVQDGGLPVDFRATAIRNLVRIVDFLPFGYGVGGIAAFVHSQSKRLGDMAAGTIVVRDKQVEVKTKRVKKDAEAPVPAPSGELNVDWALLPLFVLSRDDLAAAQRFADRRGDLDLATERRLAQEFAAPLLEALQLKPEDVQYRYGDFLVELVAYCEKIRI